MDYDNDVVKRFVDKIEQLKHETAANYDFYAIASELGYTEKDLEIIEQHAQNSILRSKEYLKKGMLKDAETEALTALDISPNNAEIYVLLGSIYKAYYKEKLFPFGYYTKALSMYKKALEINVSLKSAYNGIKEVKNIQRIYVFKTVIFVGICVAVLFFIFQDRYFAKINEKRPQVEITQTKESEPGNISRNTTNNSIINSATNSYTTNKEIPVIVNFQNKIAGLQLITQSSLLSIYTVNEPSFSVAIKGLLVSETIEVFKLELEIAWYGSDNTIIKTKRVSVIDTYHASLKPQEVYPIKILEYSKGIAPDIQKIVITPTVFDIEPATVSNYNDKLPVIWVQKPAHGFALDVYLRNTTVVAGTNDYIGKTVLSFHNSGNSRINTLKIRLVYKKDNEIVLRGKELFILTGDQGYIPPQVKFSYQILDLFSKEKFKDQYSIYTNIEVEILQIE